jgi:hypothetical protein
LEEIFVELTPQTNPAGIPASIDTEALPASVQNALVPNTVAPPVAAQRSSHVNAAKLQSEKVVIAAPLSYAGSAARIWKLTGLSANVWARIALALLAILQITGAWSVVTAWYMTFGLLVVPFRLIRRGQRKNKRNSLQHREMLAAIQSQNG